MRSYRTVDLETLCQLVDGSRGAERKSARELLNIYYEDAIADLGLDGPDVEERVRALSDEEFAYVEGIRRLRAEFSPTELTLYRPAVPKPDPVYHARATRVHPRALGAAKWAPFAKKVYGAFSKPLRKAAAVALFALAAGAPVRYDAEVAANVAVEMARAQERADLEERMAAPYVPAIIAAQPSPAAVDSAFSRGFWNTYPVAGTEKRINSFHGWRDLPSTIEGNKDHEGIDLYAPEGSVIIAPARGTISERGSTSLEVNSGSYSYRTVHIIPKRGLAQGSIVEEGDTLGTVAAKRHLPRGVNPHLHVEVIGQGGMFGQAYQQDIDPLVMFSEQVRRELVAQVQGAAESRQYVPSGLRYMQGRSVEEKLELQVREQVEALSYARLEPIVVRGVRS